MLIRGHKRKKWMGKWQCTHTIQAFKHMFVQIGFICSLRIVACIFRIWVGFRILKISFNIRYALQFECINKLLPNHLTPFHIFLWWKMYANWSYWLPVFFLLHFYIMVNNVLSHLLLLTLSVRKSSAYTKLFLNKTRYEEIANCK